MDNVIKELKNLKDLKIYSDLVKKGIIPVSVNTSFEIYNYYQIRLTVNKEFSDSISRSLEETGEQFGVCEMTVRRSLKFMES